MKLKYVKITKIGWKNYRRLIQTTFEPTNSGMEPTKKIFFPFDWKFGYVLDSDHQSEEAIGYRMTRKFYFIFLCVSVKRFQVKPLDRNLTMFRFEIVSHR